MHEGTRANSRTLFACSSPMLFLLTRDGIEGHFLDVSLTVLSRCSVARSATGKKKRTLGELG
jgi:hypothetical protein